MNNQPNQPSGTLAVKAKNQFALTPRTGSKNTGLRYKVKSSPKPVAKMPPVKSKGKKWMLSETGAVQA